MELDYYFPTTFLLPFLVLVFVFMLSMNQNKKKNLPPGPSKLPLIGNLHLLAVTAPFHRVLANLAAKYGPLMHLQLGEIRAVVVSSPETAKPFLKTHDAIFATRPSILAAEITCYGSTDVAFAPYGEYWRQLRRIYTLQLLTPKRVQLYRPIREEETSELCRWVAENEGSTIDLTEKINTTNFDIMLRAVYGKKSGEVAVLRGLIKKSLEFFTVFSIVDMYPSLKFLRLLSGMKREIEKHHVVVNRILSNIVEERRRAKPEKGIGGGEDEGGDFLDVLLKLQGDGSLQIPLTTDNIKSILQDVGGIDSSTTVVLWAMANMLKNPRILNKAQAEVRGVFDGKNRVDECFFDELHYLKLVIKETLRLHPPGPLLLPRQNPDQRCEINGYEIPAKTWVLVNVWALGRDPEYWKDAESFIPERFLEKSVDFKATALEFIPFGAGRRICPGIDFGMANVEIQLAMLLYHFDWILPNGMKPEELDMTEIPGTTGRRKSDLSVVPVVVRPLV